MRSAGSRVHWATTTSILFDRCEFGWPLRAAPPPAPRDPAGHYAVFDQLRWSEMVQVVFDQNKKGPICLFPAAPKSVRVLRVS